MFCCTVILAKWWLGSSKWLNPSIVNVNKCQWVIILCWLIFHSANSWKLTQFVKIFGSVVDISPLFPLTFLVYSKPNTMHLYFSLSPDVLEKFREMTSIRFWEPWKGCFNRMKYQRGRPMHKCEVHMNVLELDWISWMFLLCLSYRWYAAGVMLMIVIHTVGSQRWQYNLNGKETTGLGCPCLPMQETWHLAPVWRPKL